MERNKLTLVVKILAIIVICLIGFVGVYSPWNKSFEMKNGLKGFTLSKDLKGYREIKFGVHSHDGESDKELLTKENFEKSKNIIKNRLVALGVQDYNLAMDNTTGVMSLQIPEDDMTDKVVSNITQTGSIEIKDSKDENKVLVSKDKFEKARYFYSTGSTGAMTVYLELDFNKEGKEILKKLSQEEYKTLPKESEDESKEENDDKQNKVTLYISGEETTTTSFDDVIEEGKIQLSMGSASTDTETINASLKSASIIAAILNSGVLPVEYEVSENQYVLTDINLDAVKIVIVIASAIIGILLIYTIIKEKLRGLLMTICFVGFVALYIIMLRLFNVPMALSGIIGAILTVVLNYIINKKLLKVDNRDNKKYYEKYLDIIMKLIPIFAISIIFVFIPITTLSSLGMVMFWGIALILLYNVAVTKHIVD